MKGSIYMMSAEKTAIIVDGFEVCEILYQENGHGHGRAYRNNTLLFDGYDWEAFKAYVAEVQRVGDIWLSSGRNVQIVKQ
jgi:hypothetical protein